MSGVNLLTCQLATLSLEAQCNINCTTTWTLCAHCPPSIIVERVDHKNVRNNNNNNICLVAHFTCWWERESVFAILVKPRCGTKEPPIHPPPSPHPHLKAIKRRAMDQRPAAAPRQVDTGPLCLPPPASIQKHIETNKYMSIQIRKYIFIQIRKYTFIQKHKSTTVSIQQHKYAITKTQKTFTY